MAVSNLDIAWMAGLLEGEGSFCVGKRKVKDKEYKRVLISLVMTDRDVVQKAANLFECNVGPPTQPKYPGSKLIHRLSVCGQRAIEWMMTVYPLMGERRQMQIEKCIEAWKNSPGKSRKQLTKNIQGQGVTYK